MIFVPGKKGILCYVKVVPNASKSALGETLTLGDNKKILKIYVKAPPTEGKANKALIEFFAETFEVKKSCLQISKGTTQKYKTIEIICEEQEVEKLRKSLESKLSILQKK